MAEAADRVSKEGGAVHKEDAYDDDANSRHASPPGPGDAGAGEGAEEGDEDEDGGAPDDDPDSGLVPAYPFPFDFELDVCGSPIRVCRHLCRHHPGGVQGIALLFPGVHGGVGPCRSPPNNWDADALFPAVARRLTHDGDVATDCYRSSWPYMRPQMGYAVGAACRVLHHALLEALRAPSAAAGAPAEEPEAPAEEPGPSAATGSGSGAARELRVVLVGHSLGGAVAWHAAEAFARHFGPDGRGGRGMEGLEGAVVRVAGVCSLNGALDVRRVQVGDNGKPFEALAASRALLVCGEDDQVVAPDASVSLHEALPMTDKRLLSLPGGTHDLYAHKEQLIEELSQFIIDCTRG